MEALRVSVNALTGTALDIPTPHGRTIATVLADITEFECELIHKRIHAASPPRRAARPPPRGTAAEIVSSWPQGPQSFLSQSAASTP
jgi:DNA invertase Pin-like site-specific DNA recombinase